APGETRRGGARLADDEETRRRFGEGAADLLRHPRNAVGLGRLADPEDDRTARPDQREAPLGRSRWLRERLRNGGAGPVELLLLGTPPDDACVRRSDPLEERALAPPGLEQNHLPLGPRMRERATRRAATA